MHVKQMLAKARSSAPITPVEARDAMLGCFVTIHGETLKRGARRLRASVAPPDDDHARPG